MEWLVSVGAGKRTVRGKAVRGKDREKSSMRESGQRRKQTVAIKGKRLKCTHVGHLRPLP